MIARRRVLLSFTAWLSGFALTKQTRANPILLFLRFLFSVGVRAGARSGLRALGRQSVGRSGSSRIIGRSGRRFVRSRSHKEAMQSASKKEQGWTREFVEQGLEEIVFEAISGEISLSDDEIEISSDAPIYDVGNVAKSYVKIEVSNPSNSLQSVNITLYLYDVDAGLVDQKYKGLAAILGARSTETFKVDLNPLDHRGRKVLCIAQEGFQVRVSPIIYVV